ncbi:DUF5684 domain-containing protein [Flavivirga spongiicola]|uniref:DUF5684 domain-containing protein n=1 Tax=Flavivirga spongiicola TaxID=421621 RepID=A0ABU7XZ84_9FLAO|nr:DUF5684 domain-containing protein [Flavivirga sp. MEBiC05379]MDO5980882.1 DUF5684 domain-containing protein [Flavivirga sp. MEBiC05379]
MRNIELKEVIKISIKYSLFFVLFTNFIEKSYYLIFNIQKYEDVGIGQFIFNPISYMLVFIITLLLAHKKYIKTNKNAFNGILFITFFFIVISYLVAYINDFIFYPINELINNPVEQKNTGIMSLFDAMENTFSTSSFLPIFDLFVLPFQNIKNSIITLDGYAFILSVIRSKILLSTIIIFYESLFYLFNKFNRSGYQALIPIKNNLMLLELTNNPTWWIIPIYIPFVRFIPKYLINLDISKKIDKQNSFVIGMTLMPWYFYGLISLNKINAVQ